MRSADERLLHLRRVTECAQPRRDPVAHDGVCGTADRMGNAVTDEMLENRPRSLRREPVHWRIRRHRPRAVVPNVGEKENQRNQREGDGEDTAVLHAAYGNRAALEAPAPPERGRPARRKGGAVKHLSTFEGAGAGRPRSER